MLMEGEIHDIEKREDGTYDIKLTKGTNGYINYEVPWEDVPRYRSDGTKKTPEEFRDEIVAKYGEIYFNQNYGGDFMGSSHTLVSSDKLKELKSKEPELLKDNKLKVYHRPEENHQYIISVDPAKDGRDAFAVQVIDITNFQFKQVASAKLQIDYLLMPEFIYDWAKYYRNAYLIIENNEGAGQSVADQLYQTYEYENIHFDKSVETGKRKKYPGTRTTVKTRKQILQTLKTFIDNSKLEIHDEDTIKEFYTFILINNKYQADEGTHDDMIMSLALAFTLFNSTKNFEDMKKITEILFTEMEEQEEVSIEDLITVGGFDDGTDEYELEQDNSPMSYEEYLHQGNGFM